MGDTVLEIDDSCLASAEGFKQAAKVIRSDPKRRYIVVPAPGRRLEHDMSVAELLQSLRHTEHPIETMRAVKELFVEIAKDLELKQGFVDALIANLREAEGRFNKLRCENRFDYIESRGPYLSALMFTEMLGPNWRCIDATKLIRYSISGRYDAIMTKRAIRRAKLSGNVVVPAYYAGDSRGKIHTFPRDGSANTGAIVAAMIEAELYEYATDMPGVYVANPKMLPMPPTLIGRMGYSQMQEMAYRDTNVLGHEAVGPVRESGISTRLFGLETPNNPGTYVYPDGDKRAASNHCFTGITEKPGFTMFTIAKPGMNAKYQNTLDALSALSGYGLGDCHVTTGLDTLDVIVPDKKIGDQRETIAQAIRDSCSAEVTLTSEIGIVCIVGQDLGRSFVKVTHILNVLAVRGIEPIFYELGGNRANLIIGVAQVRLRETVGTIYEYILRNHL
ncbi:MAG: aspartate kinase [Patescibacteria group bacterium]|nr:aspartate kinase [Patescibacteria group bacterium]